MRGIMGALAAASLSWYFVSSWRLRASRQPLVRVSLRGVFRESERGESFPTTDSQCPSRYTCAPTMHTLASTHRVPFVMSGRPRLCRKETVQSLTEQSTDMYDRERESEFGHAVAQVTSRPLALRRRVRGKETRVRFRRTPLDREDSVNRGAPDERGRCRLCDSSRCPVDPRIPRPSPRRTWWFPPQPSASPTTYTRPRSV